MLHERKSRLKEGRTALSSSEPDLSPLRGRTVRVGAELRTTRLQYGWELEAVAAALRIRAAYLQALEAGRLADLPGNAYALGFLRTYATALGLDADEMCRRFRAEVAEVNAKTELTFPAPVPERGVPAGAVILLGVVLAIGAYVGWYRLTEHGSPAAQVPPVPPKLAHLAEPTVLAPKPVPAPMLQPAPPVAQSAVVPQVTFAAHPVVTPPARAPAAAPPAGMTATTPQPAAPAPAPPTPPTLSAGTHLAMSLTTGAAQAGSAPEAARAAAGNPSAAAAAATVATGSSSDAVSGGAVSGGAASGGAASGGAASGGAGSGAPPASPLSAVAALAPPAQAAPAPPEPAGTIIVRAVSESWIEVRDATGAIIFTKLMQPGETWTVPQEPGLTLTTGNAGGTELVVDGKVAASLGTAGEVERNQPLDPGLIKSGALPAQIAAAAAPQETHSNLRLAQ